MTQPEDVGVFTVRRRTLTDEVSEALLDYVLSEGLQVGDALPSSGRLAQQFDVSVVVVREAVAKLAGVGLLERRQGREPLVAVPDADVMSDILRMHAHFQHISVDELQACRAALEIQVARAAARVPDVEQKKAALEPIVDGMRGATDKETFNEWDLAFHVELARLAGNRACELLLSAMSGLIREALVLTMDVYAARAGTDGLLESAEQHADIARQVIAGDSRAAAAAMAVHFTYINDGQLASDLMDGFGG